MNGPHVTPGGLIVPGDPFPTLDLQRLIAEAHGAEAPAEEAETFTPYQPNRATRRKAAKRARRKR
jgi:hypothetical protein